MTKSTCLIKEVDSCDNCVFEEEEREMTVITIIIPSKKYNCHRGGSLVFDRLNGIGISMAGCKLRRISSKGAQFLQDNGSEILDLKVSV